jgi:hypothetical protein
MSDQLLNYATLGRKNQNNKYLLRQDTETKLSTTGGVSISSHQFQLQISPTGIYNFTPRKSDTNRTEIFPEKREEKED